MRLENIGIRIITASLICGLLVCSCKKDEPIAIDKDAVASSGVVTFDITSSAVWSPDVIGEDVQPQTRSGQTFSETLPMDCEGDGLPFPEEICIYMIEEDNHDQQTTTAPLTKADGEEQSSQTLCGIFAYQGTGSADNPSSESLTTFMDNVELYVDGSYSGGDKYWPGTGYWLQFYAYYPYMPSGQTDNYIEDSDGLPLLHYTVPDEITEHIDILAGKSGKIDGDVTNTVGMTLSHILSKIQVKVGDISCGEITSVRITGVSNSGTYSLADNTWTPETGTSATYEETSDLAQTNNSILSTMYLMPQTLTPDAKIEVKVKVTFTPSDPAETERVTYYTLSKSLNQFIRDWQQNKQYTFVISTPHEVEVEVTDIVEYDGDYPVKKDLSIRNTGLTEAYIRVDITGAWMVDDEVTSKQLMVSDWKENDGEYTWTSAGKPDTGSTNAKWRIGPDGYYYYMQKTSPGQELDKLFESYKLTAPAPMIGAYLELSILAQAFYITDAVYAFPDEILSALGLATDLN